MHSAKSFDISFNFNPNSNILRIYYNCPTHFLQMGNHIGSKCYNLNSSPDLSPEPLIHKCP